MNSNTIIANIRNKGPATSIWRMALHKISLASLCGALLLTAGCSLPASPLNSPITVQSVKSNPLVSPVSALPANPSAGTTTVTGIVISGVTKQPMVGVIVYLAEVFRKPGDPPDAEGAFVLDVSHSPAAATDATGRFAIINIPAKEYVMVVGDPYSKSEIVAREDGKPKLFVTKPDVLLNVGNVTVKW